VQICKAKNAFFLKNVTYSAEKPARKHIYATPNVIASLCSTKCFVGFFLFFSGHLCIILSKNLHMSQKSRTFAAE